MPDSKLSADGKKSTDPSPARSPAVALRPPTLTSNFQPIFSLAHRRLVGHEALLRGTSAQGAALTPIQLFSACATLADTVALDREGQRLHSLNFAEGRRQAEWLFLNVDSSIFVHGDLSAAARLMADVCRPTGLAPHQIVVEILEHAIEEHADIEAQVQELKDAGFLIALDDFGAGHSNFDRIFRLGPTIVKLDRSVVVKAALSQTVRRVTTQMVSLLHECGALVLMEGVERREEAMIALDSDADLVQGFYFGRPAPGLTEANLVSVEIDETWDLSDARWNDERHGYGARVQPYLEKMRDACDMLRRGAQLDRACAAFLKLPDADVCYLLDGRGRQLGRNLFKADRISTHAARDSFQPLRDTKDARWSRRPYFRRAVAAPGVVQVTRPYLTMQSQRMCITISVCFENDGMRQIVCGDVLWAPADVRPDFVLSGPSPLL